MKIRPGFVSNSSSTSFVVYSKYEITEDMLADPAITGVPKDSPFYPVVKELCRHILNEANFHDFTKRDFAEMEKSDGWNDEPVYVIKTSEWDSLYLDAALIDRGLTCVHAGRIESFGEGGDRLGTILCDHLKLTYDSGDFVVRKDNTY